MIVDLSSLNKRLRFKALNHIFTPRPIAWVCSVRENGVVNLAPFSYFGIISAEPIILSISISRRSNGSLKDTLKNVLDSKKCTISFCNEKSLDKMHASAQDIAPEISEASAYDIGLITPFSSFPPVPSMIDVAFSTTLHQVLDFERSSAILLKAQELYVKSELYNEEMDFTLDNIGLAKGGYIKSVRIDK